MDHISGKWVGEFIYGAGAKDQGKTVKFAMELFYNGEVITGICMDEESREIFSEPAMIEGSFEDGTIVLLKFYPNEEIDRSISVLAESFNANSIRYTGTLKKKRFWKRVYCEGTWEVAGSSAIENSHARNASQEGTWKMKRI